MATEAKPAAKEDPKVDLFEDDDEFEEFEIDQGWIFVVLRISQDCCDLIGIATGQGLLNGFTDGFVD